jgi:hypothetical protein
MKSDVMHPSLVQMDRDELKTLVMEVKETIADLDELSIPGKNHFAAVDMWNIRRAAKSASGLMRRNQLSH